MNHEITSAFSSDLVWQGIINTAFWLTIFLVAVFAFRQRLSDLLDSLASFKIAGASFTLKDKRSTLESYAILTDIFVELLCNRDFAEQLKGLFQTGMRGN